MKSLRYFRIALMGLGLASGAAAQTTRPADDPFDAVLQSLSEMHRAGIGERAALEAKLAQSRVDAAALQRELEALRQQVPPAAHARRMQMGVNLSEWNEYGTQAQAANVLSTFTGGYHADTRQQDPWGKPEKPWEPKPGLAFDASGYPLADAGAYGYAYAYPDGIYHFAMQGAGDVTFFGKGRNVGGWTRVNGVLRGDVDFRQARGGVLALKITGVNPADPPRNIRLIIPALPVDTPELYTPWFLNALRPWVRCVRFMQWGRTNGSPLSQWSDRRRPDEWTQVGSRGVSYEHMIEVVNALQCDAWFCIPHAASDDYIRQMATLVRDRLHPRAIVWLEFSNELWNEAGGFSQSRWLQADAKMNPQLVTPGSAAEDAAFQLARAATIWRQVFGPESSRIRAVVGGRQSDIRWAQQQLTCLEKKYGAPAACVDAIASSGYVGVASDVDQPGLSIEQLFPHLASMLAGGERRAAQAHNDLADRYRLRYVVYEGGQHLVAWNGMVRQADGTTRGAEVNIQLKADAQTTPQMGELYQKLLLQEEQLGADLFLHFASFEKGGKFGHWGLAEAIDQTGPKLQAVLDFARKEQP